MKLTIAIAAAMTGAFLTIPAFATTGGTAIVQGCEVRDMGGYLNKVDPTCTFDHQPGGNYPGSNTSGTPDWDAIDDLLNLINN